MNQYVVGANSMNTIIRVWLKSIYKGQLDLTITGHQEETGQGTDFKHEGQARPLSLRPNFIKTYAPRNLDKSMICRSAIRAESLDTFVSTGSVAPANRLQKGVGR